MKGSLKPSEERVIKMVKIKNLQCVDGCWSWTEVDEFGDAVDYRTNSDGQGIWAYVDSGTRMLPDYEPVMEWRQQVGTCQFSLRGYSASGARKKIVRISSGEV